MNAKITLSIGSMLTGMAIGHVDFNPGEVGLCYCWRHPGFKGEFKVLPPECDPATHALEEQIAFQKKQIAELNFLLNFGPNKQGRLEEASVKVLAEVGKLREQTEGDSRAK